MSISRQLKADMALLFVTFIWGSTFIVVKESIKALPPYTFMFMRFCIGAFFLCIIFPSKLRLIDKRTLFYGSVVGIAVFAGYAFQTIGLKYTAASKSAFITGLSVVMVPVLSVLYAGKKPTAQSTFGIVLALIGLIMLTLGDGQINAINKGDIYTLAGAVSFSIVIILIDTFTAFVDSTSLGIVQIIVVAMLNMVFMLLMEPKALLICKITAQVWVSLIITGIFATGVATYVQNKVQAFTSPTHAALIFACEPVFGAAFAFIIAHEDMTWSGLLGCLLILMGMIVAEIRRPIMKEN